ERDAGVQRPERHLSGLLVESVDPEVGDDDRRTAPPPAALRVVLRIAGVAGARAEVDLLDERSLPLPHDHEDLVRVDRDPARASGAREPDLRFPVGADPGWADVSEPV